MHPLSFLLRRIIYAIIITLTTEANAFFGALILLLTCLFMMTLVVLEVQWQDNLINGQHLVNEVCFYILCAILMLYCGIIKDPYLLKFIGSLSIYLVCSMIIFNTFVILYDIFVFTRLLCKRYKQQVPKKFKQKGVVLKR